MDVKEKNDDIAKTTPTTHQQDKIIWIKSYDLEQQRNLIEAANVLNPLIVKSPQNELALIRMGWLNYLQARYDLAEDYYHKALNANNNSIDARLGLTLALMAEQRWKEAALYANQVISLSAWDYFAHIRLMTCEAGLGQWESLEKHASGFVKHYTSDITGFIFLARSQAMQGKKEQAVQSYQEILFRSPSNTEAIQYLDRMF